MTDTPAGDETTPLPPVETAAPPAAGSRRGLAIGAGAAALAVIAGAAVWATTTLSGGGMQPDELVPRSTFAYAKVDLDPAANQKLAARSYFGKFPSLKDGADDDDVFENVLDDVITGDELDYTTDIKPWFDRRAAVAAFPAGEDGIAHVVAVLRSKDDGKAKASLDQAVAEAKADGADVAYRITKGYAVVGAERAVGEAVRLSGEASLRENETYRADVDRLDGDQVAVAWADLGRSFAAVKDGIPFGDLLPSMVTNQVKGRLVAGLHLTNDYAEVQGLALGLDKDTRTAGGDHGLLATLPADTAVAVSGSGLGDALGGKNGGLLDLALGQYLIGTGLSVADDLVPLLGEETVVAVGRPEEPGLSKLRVGVVSRTKEGGKAAGTARTITTILGFLGIPATAEVEGDRFVLAKPGDYTGQLASGKGRLSGSEKFEKAVGDVKGASLVAYADLDGVRRAALPLLTGAIDEPLTSVGVVAGTRGDDSYFRLRLVAE